MNGSGAGRGAGRGGARSEARRAVCAARAVGWHGEVRGPVDFGDVWFYAVLGDPVPGPLGWGWRIGCVVVCTDAYVGLSQASLLAGYSRCLVAVDVPAVADPGSNPSMSAGRGCRRPGVFDPVDVQLQAALLDQGVVVHEDAALEGCDGSGWSVLSWPGDVVASPLQRGDRWRRDGRWRRFHRAVTAAPFRGRVELTSSTTATCDTATPSDGSDVAG